jgi:hypothetical protein
MRTGSRKRSRAASMNGVPPCSAMQTRSFPGKSSASINTTLLPQWGRTPVALTVSSGVVRYKADTCCGKPGVPPGSRYDAALVKFAIHSDRQWLQDAAGHGHPALSSPSRQCRPGTGSTTATLPPGAIQSPKQRSQRRISNHSVIQFDPIAVEETASSAQFATQEHGTRAFTTHLVSSGTSTPSPPSISTPLVHVKRKMR